jgi:hypothetical protein
MKKPATQAKNQEKDRSQGKPTKPVSPMVLLILSFIPFFWLCCLLHTYYVPTFHSDEWKDTLPMISHYLTGRLTLDDLTCFNQEQRLFFSRVVMLGLAILTKWSSWAEGMLQVALAVVVLVILYQIVRKTKSDLRMVPIVSFMIFTPASYECWMNPYQISFWIPLALLCAIPLMEGLKWKCFWITTACFVASFSSAAGLAAWTTALIILFDHFRKNHLKFGGFVAAAIVTAVLYFHGYTHKAEVLDIGPQSAITYYVAYFGNPFSRGFGFNEHTLDLITGAIVLAAFAAGTVISLRQKGAVPGGPLLPWVAIGAGMLVVALETMIGRSSDPTMPSRYVVFSAVMFICALFLTQGLLPKFRDFAIGGMVAIAVLSAASSSNQWQHSRRLFILSYQFQQMIDLIDETNKIANFTIVPLASPADTVGQVRDLEHAGWITTAHVEGNQLIFSNPDLIPNQRVRFNPDPLQEPVPK